MKRNRIYSVVAIFLVAVMMDPMSLSADTIDPSYTPDQVVVKDGIKYVCQGGEACVYECVTEKPHIVIPSKVTNRGKSYTVTSIDKCAFYVYDTENGVPTRPVIETIVLPSTIKEIGDAAFRGCKNLKSINFPESVEIIGKSAFMNCNSLVSVELPPRLKKLEYWLFGQCERLKHVIVPASVEEIDKEAFYLCKNLETVTLLNPDTYLHTGGFRHSPDVEVIGGGRIKYR